MLDVILFYVYSLAVGYSPPGGYSSKLLSLFDRKRKDSIVAGVGGEVEYIWQ